MSLIYSRLYVICKEKIVLALQRTSDNRKKNKIERSFVFTKQASLLVGLQIWFGVAGDAP